jgi:drug/metabolite transporter (DMT)-like permease
MFAVALAVAGIVLLALAGLNINGPRFRPEWLGLACITAALLLPALSATAHR